MQESSVRRYAALGGFGLVHLVVLLGLLCAAGCAGEKLKFIKGMEQFQQEVLASPQPVLVAFYKQGCATCVPLDPILEKLNDEYKDRAVVAKCMLLTFFFGNTIPELRTKYDIQFYPTVVLFVNGQEKQRWVISYKTDSYREHINRWLADAMQPTSGPASGPVSRPASGPGLRAPVPATQGVMP